MNRHFVIPLVLVYMVFAAACFAETIQVSVVSDTGDAIVDACEVEIFPLRERNEAPKWGTSLDSVGTRPKQQESVEFTLERGSWYYLRVERDDICRYEGSLVIDATNEVPKSVSLIVSRGGLVRGKIICEAAKDFEYAEVEARSIPAEVNETLSPREIGEVISKAPVQADGTFELWGLPQSGKVRICTSSTEFSPGYIDIELPMSKLVNLQVEMAREIVVQYVGEDGSPFLLPERHSLVEIFPTETSRSPDVNFLEAGTCIISGFGGSYDTQPPNGVWRQLPRDLLKVKHYPANHGRFTIGPTTTNVRLTMLRCPMLSIRVVPAPDVDPAVFTEKQSVELDILCHGLGTPAGSSDMPLLPDYRYQITVTLNQETAVPVIPGEVIVRRMLILPGKPAQVSVTIGPDGGSLVLPINQPDVTRGAMPPIAPEKFDLALCGWATEAGQRFTGSLTSVRPGTFSMADAHAISLYFSADDQVMEKPTYTTLPVGEPLWLQINEFRRDQIPTVAWMWPYTAAASEAWKAVRIDLPQRQLVSFRLAAPKPGRESELAARDVQILWVIETKTGQCVGTLAPVDQVARLAARAKAMADDSAFGAELTRWTPGEIKVLMPPGSYRLVWSGASAAELQRFSEDFTEVENGGLPMAQSMEACEIAQCTIPSAAAIELALQPAASAPLQPLESLVPPLR